MAPEDLVRPEDHIQSVMINRALSQSREVYEIDQENMYNEFENS